MGGKGRGMGAGMGSRKAGGKGAGKGSWKGKGKGNGNPAEAWQVLQMLNKIVQLRALLNTTKAELDDAEYALIDFRNSHPNAIGAIVQLVEQQGKGKGKGQLAADMAFLKDLRHALQ